MAKESFFFPDIVLLDYYHHIRQLYFLECFFLTLSLLRNLPPDRMPSISKRIIELFFIKSPWYIIDIDLQSSVFVSTWEELLVLGISIISFLKGEIFSGKIHLEDLFRLEGNQFIGVATRLKACETSKQHTNKRYLLMHITDI